jgi:Flp pilus assembly protein TadB
MTEMLKYVVPLLASGLIILLFLAAAHSVGKGSGDDDFARRLRDVNRSEFETVGDKKPSAASRWTNFWYALTIQTGTIPSSPQAPGRMVMVFMLILFGFGSLVVPADVVAGTLMSVAAPVIWRMILKRRIGRRSKQMDKQLPRLLSSMRANLQSNYTPQQAILAVVDEIPAPLGNELKIMRDEIRVNVPLQEALRNLAARVPSREMKFLVSSIEISSVSGSDLDPQLRIIQQIVQSRSRTASRLATAVASVQPSILIAGIVIPGSFAFSYLSDPANKAYWTTFSGLMAAGVVAVLYAVGLIVVRKLISNVENS